MLHFAHRVLFVAQACALACLGASVLLACAQDRDGRNGVPGPEHGLDPSKKISELTDEQRLKLCIDAIQRLKETEGAREDECAADAFRSQAYYQTSAQERRAACKKDLDACIAAPEDTRTPEDVCTSFPFIPPGDKCTVTVALYDRCLTAKLRENPHLLGTFSCDDLCPGDVCPPLREPMDDLPECSEPGMRWNSCAIIGPSTFK